MSFSAESKDIKSVREYITSVDSCINVKRELLNELAADIVNILRVRKLCRENPGLVASTGLRIRIWILLLLGSQHGIDDTSDIISPDKPCEEQHVLDADVRRTRSDMEDFRSTSWRKSVMDMLQSFCLKHGIQYKQGMNEVVAPFIYIIPPPNGSALPFALFEAFLFRYLERYFCLDESSYLFKAFRFFHLLLAYHDPQLALHLHDQGFPPELYSPQWFLTLYSRSLPMKHVLRLWDIMIAIDDPAFTFFIGLTMLQRLRDELLLKDSDMIPEIISKIGMSGEEDVDLVASEALAAYRETPRCFCRNLRLCCVGTTELNPRSTPYREKPADGIATTVGRLGEHDYIMAGHSARSCVMMSAQELVDSLAPMVAVVGAAAGGSGLAGSATHTPQQHVIIDIRSVEDSEDVGGGTMPRSIQLEPEFLDRPDALEAWLQHFDGTKGCHICIIDMPPVHLPSVALWRRLLLGEGDGLRGSGASVYGTTGVAAAGSEAPEFNRDLQSPYLAEEEAAIADDKIRPAMRLARELQRVGFPFITVLDGGFPALVDQLIASRGGVEPVVINHNAEKWRQYLVASGRVSDEGAPRSSFLMKGSGVLKSSASGGGRPGAGASSSASAGGGDASAAGGPKKYKQLSQLEVATIAYRVAAQNGHTHMEAILLDKMNSLSNFSRPPPI